MRGIANKQDRRGIYAWNDSVLQGMDCSWYEMLSQRDGTLPHTAKYHCGQLTFMTEFLTTTLVLFRVGCSWPPSDPDTNCVDILFGFLENYVCSIRPWSMADLRSERRTVS